MKREIKFRAWSQTAKTMYTKVMVGNISDPNSEDYTANSIFIDGEWVNSDEHDSIEWMQYTGLKDRKGVDVYDGDIVLCDKWNEPQLVFWDKFSFTCFIPEIEDYSLAFLAGYKNFKVIGNIYENPELLWSDQ